MSQEKPLVLVTHTLPAAWLAPLKEKCRLMIGPEGGKGLTPRLEENLPEAEALFTLLVDPITEDILERAPNLKVVSQMAVGVDNLDVEACTRRGIPVGHTPGILTAATADLTWGLLLAVARHIPQSQADARAGRWTTWNPTGWLGADLEGATLGIVGMGKIGSAVARRASGFGMELIFTNRSPRPDIEKDLNAQQVPLEDLLEQSDFVSLHVPLTEETHHLIDANALQKMKSTAILVNAARGQVVETQALLQGLQESWIAAAGLDVTHPEPLPSEHPLYAQSNCLITPHIGSASYNTRRRMAEIACQNVLAGLEGSKLPHSVN
ncbi:MAG: Glyoxylate/hydroxypyruvate reductase B [Chloroflexi bacterium]|nr:Glyoxylate/hydroxypyruvate reductase B [Chloroflexota bacterium]